MKVSTVTEKTKILRGNRVPVLIRPQPSVIISLRSSDEIFVNTSVHTGTGELAKDSRLIESQVTSLANSHGDYTVDLKAPEAGTYTLIVQVSVINRERQISATIACAQFALVVEGAQRRVEHDELHIAIIPAVPRYSTPSTKLPVFVLALATQPYELGDSNPQGLHYLEEYLYTCFHHQFPSPILENELSGNPCTMLVLQTAAFGETGPKGNNVYLNSRINLFCSANKTRDIRE